MSILHRLGFDRCPTPFPTTASERGQSETVGVLMLTGIVIVLALTVGVAMTLNVTSQTETAPQIDLEGSATKDTVTLEHAGGSRLEVADLEVVLRGDSTERYDLASFTQRSGTNTTWFEAGDSWQRDHGLSGDTVEVLLVDTASNTIAGRTTLELTATGPFFEVEITDTNSPVEQGESLEVDVAVENTGIDTGTQDVEFTFDGAVEGTESVTLSPGNTASRTFTYDTSGDPPDTYTIGASTDNRTAEETVIVTEKQANITVTAVEGLSDGTTNDTYQSSVTVTESANIETDGLGVELIVEERDSKATVFQETKTPGEISSESLTVDFDVGQLDANSYNYFTTAAADNAVTDGESGEFVVGEPPFFNVTIDGTNSPVNSGSTVSVDATIENTGGIEGTQTVRLDIDGATEDSQSVTLAGSANQTITLEWTTSNNAHNDSPYTATVSSDDDSDATQITVESGGGSTPPTVTTQDATEIGGSSATLNGELTDTGTANNVDVYFEYREVGVGGAWTSTTPESLSAPGTFSATISGLSSGTNYEFRAVAETNNDGSDTGSTLTFTTADPDPPEFTSIDVTSAGSGNNNDQLTFEYTTTNDATGVTLFAETSRGTELVNDPNALTDTTGTTYTFDAVNMNARDINIEMTVENADGESRTCSGTITTQGGTLTETQMTCVVN
jgi:flagellin-like protein